MRNNIYIIDQEANSLFSLKSRFSEIGFNVRADYSFYDIERVVDDISDFGTNILIFDIDHEFWDWTQLLHEIRVKDELKEIFVIVYSFNGSEGIEKKVLNRGANYFFSKNDFTIDEFIKKIINIQNKILKK